MTDGEMEGQKRIQKKEIILMKTDTQKDKIIGRR